MNFCFFFFHPVNYEHEFFEKKPMEQQKVIEKQTLEIDANDLNLLFTQFIAIKFKIFPTLCLFIKSHALMTTRV